MITRIKDLVTGLAALAVLTAVVAGLPVVLYRFGGSPLPRSLPSWHHTTALLASPGGGAVLLAVIRDCAWLAWVLLTACILAEAQAAVRGRQAPWLRLGGLQGAAAQLVTLATLTFSGPTAISLSASVTVVTSEHVPGGGDLGAPPAIPVLLDSTTTAGPGISARVVTVRAGDCLWSIAARYLGAGDRYPEIARLNYGRRMGDGEVFTNPARIYPGWQLLMPGGAAGPAQATASAPAPSAPVLSAPGPSVSARSALAAPAAANSPALASPHPGHPTRDSHYQRRHPVAAAAAPGSAKTATAAMGQPASSGAERETGVQEAAVFVTGALAGAIVTSLSRMRFRQRQLRRPGRRIALPRDASVLATEQRLRAAAPAEPVHGLRGALACLEAGILASGQQLPEIVGVHVTPDLLELLLAAPPPEAPPAPWEVSPGRQGMSWQLALPAAAGQAIGPADCHVLPGLVSIGATADGYLLLDLESLQVTGCDGPPALVASVVATIATELATGQWSGWYDLILVGCDELAPVGRAEHCRSIDEALSMLEARCAARAHRISERGPADVRALRLAEPENEDWGLAILVSRAEPSAAELTRLLDLAVDSWGGIAALVAGDAEATDGRMAPTVLQLAPDPECAGDIVANVVPLQIRVRPRVLSAAEYDAISSLFAVATDLGDVGPDEPPYAAYGTPPWVPQAAALHPEQEAGTDGPVEPGAGEWSAGAAAGGAASPPVGGLDDDGEPDLLSASGLAAPAGSGRSRPGAVDIRILGPLAITGTAEQLQPSQAELVLALALAAPAGLSNSALRSMLGADPDHPKPSDAVRQIIARTRRRLGPASDGRERIIHAGGGQYVLHPEAVLDWSRFREFVASGRADDLRAALALVRGQPFAGSYFWWIDIPLVEAVRAEISDAAETLAEFELATGSPRAAARAARAGLLAEPSAEHLWRAVMRAEHAAGNLAGVAEAWRRCLDAIEDVAPGGEPHPDTVALYRQFTRMTPEHASAR